MKRKAAYFLISVLSLIWQHAAAQTDSLPYLKNPEMPALIFLDLDSTEFNTFHIKPGKKTVLIYFSPTCEHCEMLTKELIANQDSLSNTEIYMVSPVDMSVTKEFDAKYQVSKQKKMNLYKDVQHIFASYYGVRYLPFVVIYDKNKKLIRGFEGGIKMSDLNAIDRE